MEPRLYVFSHNASTSHR